MIPDMTTTLTVTEDFTLSGADRDGRPFAVSFPAGAVLVVEDADLEFYQTHIDAGLLARSDQPALPAGPTTPETQE